jgi:hypothetical protein
MADSLVENVVTLLAAAGDSPLRDEAVRLFVDHVFAQRMRDAADLKVVHGMVVRSLTQPNLARIVARHVKPGWRRYTASAASSTARVGDLVPESARAKLLEIARDPRYPQGRWTRGMIDPALLKKLLGPVWVQLLLSFAKRFPGLGAVAEPASSGGLASRLSRSVQQQAGRLASAGRSVMEGLGIDVEQKLMAAARDFSDGALAVWNIAMSERMRSEEGRALIAQIKMGVVEHVLRTAFSDLQLDVAELPIEAVMDVTPEIVAHAAPGQFVQQIVKREIDAYLESEGDRTVGELLAELGVLDETRALLVVRGGALLRGLSATPGFAEWLTRLHDAAGSR